VPETACARHSDCQPIAADDTDAPDDELFSSWRDIRCRTTRPIASETLARWRVVHMLVQNVPQSLVITAESGLGVERWCLKQFWLLQVGVDVQQDRCYIRAYVILHSSATLPAKWAKGELHDNVARLSLFRKNIFLFSCVMPFGYD